jgi:hypothetical protein
LHAGISAGEHALVVSPPSTLGDRSVRDWPYLLVLAAVFAAAWLAVGPGPDAPYIDDWVYARVVEQFLQTGEVRVPAMSSVYPLAQAAWALPFAAVMGFSFVALRLSTLALAWCGCAALYLTLRESGCRRDTSLLGAVALLLHPVFFGLAFSFMTEVPFVSFSLLSLYWYARAVSRDDTRAAWVAGMFALATFLVRPIGIMLPLAAVPVLLWRRDWRPAARRVGPALAVTVTVMLALQVGLPRLVGPLDWADTRSAYLQWWFTVPMADYARWTVEAVVQASFPVAPLLLALLAVRRHVPAMAAATVFVGAVSWFGPGLQNPLPDGQTWSLQEFTARNMLPGAVPSPPWAPALLPWLQLAGVLTASAVVVMALRGWTRRAGWAWGRVEALLAIYGLLQLGAVHALWLYNDRYYVVLAPVLVFLAARALDGMLAGRAVAMALLVAWAAIDITGARDMLGVNGAAADAVRALEASGVPAWQIDAGYTLNGWRLYVHPEHLPPGADPRNDVPRVTAGPGGTFGLTNAPVPGETVVRTLPLAAATWQATRALHVVRLPPPATTTTPP